jgi:mannosyltransferase OCH1-like enzyme
LKSMRQILQLRSLKMNNHIPKLIHLTWKNKSILYHKSPLIQNGIKNLIEMNPDWKATIYDDDDINNYLKDNLSEENFRLFDNCGIVEKTDIWRLIKIYNEGGLYSDVDRYHNIPLDDILDPETKCVLPTSEDFDFSHTFMMSAPENPIFEKAINLLLHRRREGITNIYFLGPQTYMHAITLSIFGELIDSDPGKEKIERMRSAINSVPFLKTYRETPPGIMITNRSNVTLEEYEKQKRELYHSYGMKHWTGLW